MSIEMPSVALGSGDCWLPFVQILELLDKTADNPTQETLDSLEQHLNRYRGCYRTLFTTKPKNQKHRDYIKSGVTEPILLPSCDINQTLSLELVSETLLLSDILDLDEFQALDLLVTGEAEAPNYPCWPRGIIAVNMYYEGRHALISSLRVMTELLPGHTWGTNTSPRVLEIIKPFIDSLFSDNLIDKILDLIPKCEVQKQLEILDDNCGLGDWRHRTEILKCLTGIKIELAKVIFCLAAQQRLPWKTTQRILEYLRHIELKRDVKFHKEDVLLISAVLHSLDNNLHVDNFDKDYALEFRKYVLDAENTGSFLCRELLEFFNINYYIAVYKLLSKVTINYQAVGQEGNTFGFGNTMETSKELLGEDELEFKTDVFTFLKVEIFSNECTEVSDEYYVILRFHELFVDFITYMPMKWRDMKARSEDSAKTMLLYLEQGISQPPQVPDEYDSLLDCMGTFYYLDKGKRLASRFFSLTRAAVAMPNFVRSLCHDSPLMFVCNVKFLTGLGRSCPQAVFELLKPHQHNLSFTHFFDSISKYLSSFGQISNNSDFMERDPLQPKATESTRIGLRPHELNGIMAYLKLLQAICTDFDHKRYFVEVRGRWVKLILTGAGIRSLPLELRAEMLKTAAAMIPTHQYELDTCVSLWEALYAAHLLQPGSGDLRDELEERETRLESYILCNGFLQLLDSLAKVRSNFLRKILKLETGRHIVKDEGPALDNLVGYVRDAVLMKLAYRTYRSIPERWETTALSISFLSNLLDEVPVLMGQFLSDSPVLRTILNILVDCTKVREMSTGKVPYVDQASQEVLNLIYQVVIRQNAFLERNGKFAGGTVLHGIHDVILSVNTSTGRAEYLIALLKFVDKFNPAKHQELSLQILTAILTQHSELEGYLYTAITSDSKQAFMLEYTFAQCLSNPECSTIVKQNILKLVRCSAVNPAPNLGLFLLGVDKKINFQQRADKSKPQKSILHYILENVEELPDVFLTLLELLRDDRLRDPLLRHLRATQFFVKYYLNSFSSATMDINDIGYFLKCISIDLKNSTQISALGHALVSKDSHNFFSILKRIDLSTGESEVDTFPTLTYFEQEQVQEAITRCEYVDRDCKATLVDVNKLKTVFKRQMKKLEKTTTPQLNESVKCESEELFDYAEARNEIKRKKASMVLLFDCWRQCLEVMILMPSTLKAAGIDFVTSVLRLVIDKMRNTEATTKSLLRLGAEIVLSLCGVLRVFKEDLSESMLNLILTSLCVWISTEESVTVRGVLYPSIMTLMEIMRDQNKCITSRINYAVIIDALCKDCLHAGDTGKINAMYLLGEIIDWSMRSGYRGRIPYVDKESLRRVTKKTQPQDGFLSFQSGCEELEKSTSTSVHDDEIEGVNGMPWEDISVIPPTGHDETVRFIQTPFSTMKTRGATTPKAMTPQPLNSTALPTDVRDKQHVPPGQWQTIQNNETFLAFLQKQGDEGAGFGLNNKDSTLNSSTIMYYMRSKGLVQHLIASLTTDDDFGLMQFFSSSTESVNLKSHLIFQARMHVLNRFAETGPFAARLLQEDNLIPRLADMQAFKVVARMKLWEPKPIFGTHMSIDAQIANSIAEQQATYLDSIYISVWTVMHSMQTNLPNNLILADQIWRFIQIHKESVISLLGRCPTEKEPEAIVPEVLSRFLRLFTELPEKTQEHSLEPNDDIYGKISETLKDICRKNVFTPARAAIAVDLLHFLLGYCHNPKVLGDTKKFIPSRPVLLSCLNYQELKPEATNMGLTVGDILLLVQLVAYHIPRWEGGLEVLKTCVRVCEIGLTLVYAHMDIYVRSPFPIDTARRLVSSAKDPKANLQNDVAFFLEETLVKTMKEAIESLEQRARNTDCADYFEDMLQRLRRVSHIRRI